MSYGINAPVGLRPTYMLSGATWNEQTSDYLIALAYGTSIFTGDPVILATTGTIDRQLAEMLAVKAPIMGVFMGCEYVLNGTYVYSPFWPAGTSPDNGTYATAFVVDDPNVVFDIQVASNAAFANPTIVQTDMGLNANFAVAGVGNPAAGSTITGQSAYYFFMKALTPGTSATLNLKLLRFTPNPKIFQAQTLTMLSSYQ